jgi:hypothetical protein
MHNFDLLRSKAAFYQSEAAFLRSQIVVINTMAAKWPHYKPAFSEIKKQYDSKTSLEELAKVWQRSFWHIFSNSKDYQNNCVHGL